MGSTDGFLRLRRWLLRRLSFWRSTSLGSSALFDLDGLRQRSGRVDEGVVVEALAVVVVGDARRAVSVTAPTEKFGL